MLNITWLNLCFQGLICFVHSPKHSCKTSNIELWGRRGPRGWKGLNISSIYGTGRGRRPETYRRTCVCCFQVMPGSSSYCSYCCHVPCLFPVPFQCLSSAFSSAFCTFSWPCQQKCVSGKFCWNKKISYLFLAKKWVTWQNHWQAHTKGTVKRHWKGTGNRHGTWQQ